MAAEHPEHLSLVLIRHGQTAYNLSGKIQGSMDIPLNERGREQARGLRDAVTHLLAVSPVPVKVFASPLSRAYETAAIALDGRTEPVIEVDDRLAEIDYGSWCELTRANLIASVPEAYERWFARLDLDYCPHGGESFNQLKARAAAFHAEQVAPLIGQGNQRVLVFSHGGLIQSYLNHLFQNDAGFSTSNTSITEVLLFPHTLPRLIYFNLVPNMPYHPGKF